MIPLVSVAARRCGPAVGGRSGRPVSAGNPVVLPLERVVSMELFRRSSANGASWRILWLKGWAGREPAGSVPGRAGQGRC